LRPIRGKGGLQGCRAVGVRRIWISAVGQQHVDRIVLATRCREHQAVVRAHRRIDADLGAQDHPQLLNVTSFGCTPQARRRVGRRR